jgi:hypothetical protein
MSDFSQHWPLHSVCHLHENQSGHRQKADFPDSLVQERGLVADERFGHFTVRSVFGGDPVMFIKQK